MAETYPVPAAGNLSIHVQLLPFVEQANLQAQYEAAVLSNSSQASNSSAAQALIPIYVCPSDPNVMAISDGTDSSGNPVVKYADHIWLQLWRLAHLQLVRGSKAGDGAFIINSPQTPAGFMDGMSNTLGGS